MPKYPMIAALIVLSVTQMTWASPPTFGQTSVKVRCWARLNPQHEDPQTYWKWAQNDDGTDYKISGYWRSGIDPIDLFYTDTSQPVIRYQCQKTLKLGPNDDLLWFAANDTLSFNQTIWSNDATIPPTDTINKIISFGDSISDTGNLFNRFQWRFPNKDAWFLGHFSNGLVWAEYLAQYTSLPLYTWAVGGAAGTDKYLVIPGLDEQVNAFINDMKKAKNVSLKNDLFLIEIGLNDFLNYDRSVEQVTVNLDRALATLVAQGAKNILILRLPDISIAPKFHYISAEKTQQIQQKIIAFNIHLEEITHLYNVKNINMALYYTDILFSKMHAHPQQYGLSNVTQPCLNIARDSSEDFLLNHKLRPACISIGVDRYLFWGITHPTTQAHKIIAQAIEQTALKRFHFASQNLAPKPSNKPPTP